MWTNLDRAVRFLRRRRRWRQEDLGGAAGVSRQAVSRLEHRQLDGMTIGTLCKVAAALGASVHIELRWRGEQLDRLIDAAHAAIVEEVAQLLIRHGWLVRTEVSFSHFGERGRCDIVAHHPVAGFLLIVEIKSRLGDLQDTVGRLDAKARLGSILAAQLEWPAPAAVVAGLVIGESGSARRSVAEHPALFSRFARRGRAAVAWVRAPGNVAEAPTGLLWFAKFPDSRGVSVNRSPRMRVGREQAEKSPPAPPA